MSKILMRIIVLVCALFSNALGMEVPLRFHKVVILGGGMAGLSAAHALAKKGIIPALYEGRDRLGGRVNTHYFNPEKTAFFEEGGTFIDADHKATQALTTEFKVELVKHGFGTRKISIFNDHHSMSSQALLAECIALKEALLHIQADLNVNYKDYLEYKGAQWYWKPLKHYVDQSNINAFGKGLLKALMESSEGIPFEDCPVTDVHGYIDDISEYIELFSHQASWWKPNKAVELFGGYHYTVRAGMSSFVQKIEASLRAKQVPIHLHQKLTRIHKAAGKYTLTFDHGEQIEAEYVIMTLPFSTLRDVKMDPEVISDFNPVTEAAIRTLAYGTNSKIGVQISAPQNLSAQMLYYVNTASSITGWPGENALTLFVSAHEGRALNEQQTIAIFKRESPNVVAQYPTMHFVGAPLFKNWSQDPFSKGSYSAVTTDSPHDFTQESPTHKGWRLFAEPANHNRFIFAGEHTQMKASGHIEGAVQSGISAASILTASITKEKT
jgi:monoamine oxidase